MSPDHPRARGVYPASAASAGSAWGIIPAHAGFTSVAYPRVHTIMDHPRTRGVYISAAFGFSVPVGSSPHTRGLQTNAVGILASNRIIPAHAGFTPA